eukprot:GFUD01131504.1.p1 GENE.GFUD01131504.1~~GFUD01131504.1.p1  ORF type:complete len:381 (-),score=72.29 GFUD01131504.1:121-1263(-)
MDSRHKMISILALTSFTFLYLVFTSFPGPVKFAQLNITELIQKRKCGLDFAGAYAMDGQKKSPRKRTGQYYNMKTKQSAGPNCSSPVRLQMFGPDKVLDQQMFFLETSGRSSLSPRQACSVESAAKLSNLHIQVILLSATLDLMDNSTCYLYQTASNVSFYTIDMKTIFVNTPLQDIIRSKKFAKSQYKITHQSDALRLALIFKYGGFYSDLDAVTIHDLSKFKNVIGSTKINSKVGTLSHLANGEFHFERKHQLLWETMKMFTKAFTGNARVEVGPILITKTVKSLFHTDSMETVKSKQLTVLPIETFYPIKAFEVSLLWPTEPKSFTDWSRTFENSSMIHFYASQTNKWVVERDPSHEAYAVIAPRYCPVAFWSSDQF